MISDLKLTVNEMQMTVEKRYLMVVRKFLNADFNHKCNTKLVLELLKANQSRLSMAQYSPTVQISGLKTTIHFILFLNKKAGFIQKTSKLDKLVVPGINEEWTGYRNYIHITRDRPVAHMQQH